jgi:hypothetical protein
MTAAMTGRTSVCSSAQRRGMPALVAHHGRSSRRAVTHKIFSAIPESMDDEGENVKKMRSGCVTRGIIRA